MATKPTPGGSDGTYGTELNAFLDVSLASDGKVINEALQTASTAPVADAALANKKYVDDQVDAEVTARSFGTLASLDSASNTLVKDGIYKAGSDGFVMAWQPNQENLKFLSDGSNPPTTELQGATEQIREMMRPVKKDDYWKITSSQAVVTIYWLPIGSGTCVKQ